MLKKYTYIVALGLFVVACAEPSNEPTTDTSRESETQVFEEGGDVNVEDAERLIAEKQLIVLDVRTADEYASGHMEGAKSIDFHAADFKQQLESLDKSQPYLVYCHSGRRSAQSMALMKEAGFVVVYNMLGGMSAWREQGKAVAN